MSCSNVELMWRVFNSLYSHVDGCYQQIFLQQLQHPRCLREPITKSFVKLLAQAMGSKPWKWFSFPLSHPQILLYIGITWRDRQACWCLNPYPRESDLMDMDAAWAVGMQPRLGINKTYPEFFHIVSIFNQHQFSRIPFIKPFDLHNLC